MNSLPTKPNQHYLFNMGTFFRILFKTIAWLFVLLITIILILSFIGVKVDLSFLRPGVEISASKALGREVTIAGPVELEFSTWPSLELSEVKISNLPGASQPVFLNAGLVRMQLGIFPLLRGKINIPEITAENVTMNLESDAQGKPNWVFGKSAAPQPEQPLETETQAEVDGKLITFAALDQLSLQQITVNYHDAALNKSLSFVLDSMLGTAAKGEPVVLDLAGKLEDKKYEIEVQGNPLNELLEMKDEPWGFEMEGEVFGKKITAKADMMLRDHKPEINLALGLRDVDVGNILSELGLVKGMQASLGDVDMKVSINGGSLQEILQQSSMLFKVRGGSWKVMLPNSEASFDINNLQGDIHVEKGNNITMTLNGIIDKTPVKLLITGEPLVEYITNQDEIPLTIDAEFAKSRFSFYSKVKLPLTNRDISLALKASSERIDHLNELFHLDLPPIGPVSLESRLYVSGEGYNLSKLVVQVGDSHLHGQLKLSALKNKPKLDISLVSKLIQLDDFDTGQQQQAATEQPESETDSKQAPYTNIPDAVTKAQQSGDTKKLLSYEVLSAFDADIRIEAQDVRSGKDKLGSALMQIGLKDTRLAVEPLSMKIPGGDILANMDYTLSPTDIAFNLKADIREFDLGVLARRLKPGTDMGGKFTLDAELHSQAPDLVSVMEYASGHFDFALVPENFSADIIDLWAVNLLSAIMEKSTEKDQSTINCVVVRFGIEDGLMEENAIYLDTTNMRIAGKSEINFKTRELGIKLAPKAKNPEFFNMAIPIQVKGSFDDFGLKIGVIRMGGQVVSFVTSPFHVPIRRIFISKEPADGVDACKLAWTATGEEMTDKQPQGTSVKK